MTDVKRDFIESHWASLRPKIKERWSRLTEDELDLIDGNHDQLIGTLQEEYAMEENQAEREVNEFLETCC